MTNSQRQQKTEELYNKYFNSNHGDGMLLKDVLEESMNYQEQETIKRVIEMVEEVLKCSHFGHTDGEQIDCNSQKLYKLQTVLSALTSLLEE